MSTDPQSIASIIEGQQHDVGSLGAVPGGEEDQAALLTYLKTHYSDPLVGTPSLTANELPPLPSTSYRQTPTPGPGPSNDTSGGSGTGVNPPSHDYSRYTVRAASPVNESIIIPSTLADLAASSSITVDIPSYASDFHERLLDQSGGVGAGDAERGEMGGKRRKQPHERAGWKEMDEEPKMKRRRGGRRPAARAGAGAGAEAGPSGDDSKDLTAMANVNANVDPALVGASLGALAAVGQDSSDINGPSPGVDPALQPQDHPHAQAQAQPEPPAPAPEMDSKESRAAQNRRAQQVFRRKREEHMKKLEADSAAFNMARHNLMLSEARLRQVALQLEAEHIEKMALRLALRTLSQARSTSVLDTEGSLVMSSATPFRPSGVTDSPEELDKAFSNLEAQSRELAKTNRSRRV